MDFSGAVWHKSTRSDSNSQCVEWANFDHVVAVRDSKDPAGPVLTFGRAEWAAFVHAAKLGDFDR